MKSIKLGLEWFLNPDHLPFIAGIEKGWFRDAGLDLTLVEPEGHYDGLAEVASGKLAFACNEPLHMIDEARPGLRALGCFFETEGGVMITPEGEERLVRGETIRVASPVAGEVTDDLARVIVERWCEHQAVEFEASQLQIESAGFEHLKNLQAGYHGAWLCFANFEGVEAKEMGVKARLISSNDVGLPNFSALELFTGEAFHREYPELVEAVTRIASEGATLCREDPEEAKRLWYRFSGEEQSDLMDAIVRDTCHRLVAPVVTDAGRWREMWREFNRMGLSPVDEAAYNELFTPN
ncbi:MAG: ABC transporter substrate-binding protein [Guyparkeria sp.]